MQGLVLGAGEARLFITNLWASGYSPSKECWAVNRRTMQGGSDHGEFQGGGRGVEEDQE